MNKELYKNIFLFVSVLIFATSIVVFFNFPEQETAYQISVLTRDLSDENGHNALKQGMEQAASDLEVDLSFSTVDELFTNEAFKEAIDKEISSGTAGLIIEPMNDEGLGSELLSVHDQYPLVFVNSQISGIRKIETVQADNYETGSSLAVQIIKRNMTNKPVLVLEQDSNYSEIRENYEGLSDKFKENKVPVADRRLSGEDFDSQLKELLAEDDYFAVVSFSSFELERIGKLKRSDSALSQIELYGFGVTNQLLSLVDSEVIQGLGVSNQFSIGYTAVEKLMADLKQEKMKIPEFTALIVNKENLFDESNEKLLFPFIQ